MFSISAWSYQGDVETYRNLTKDEITQTIHKLRLDNTVKAIEFCQKGYNYYINEQDTVSAINILLEESNVYGHKAQYQLSYDRIWKAHLLANKVNHRPSLVLTMTTLGRYFSFYKRADDSFKYLNQALAINKELVQEGIMQKSTLIKQYYLIAKTHRELSNPSSAANYLDSCYLYGINKNHALYHSFRIEESILNSNLEKGIEGLKSVIPFIKENDEGFQVLVYKYIGDKYAELGMIKEAEEAFLLSIELSEELKSHVDFSPLIYKSLSKLYAQTGRFQKAYQASISEKNLDAIYFDSRSENNRSLLYIQDKYQEEVEQKEQLLQKQKLQRLELEEREAFLKNMVLTIFLIFALLMSSLYFAYMKNKHKNEKKLIQKKKELEFKQTNELLEIKNRELAVSSLKLIQKDELLSSLKENLAKNKGDIKREEIKKIVRTISHSNSNNWEEFETRFTSVNRDFYQKLNSKFPKLTRGDQKLCALIKLNFSSKEMAKILGISIESVHTNRYRLRKKVDLTRDKSLTEFVATL